MTKNNKHIEEAVEEFNQKFGFFCSTCDDEGFTIEQGHANTPHENGECDGYCPIQEQVECACGGNGNQIRQFLTQKLQEVDRKAREQTLVDVLKVWSKGDAHDMDTHIHNCLQSLSKKDV